MDSYQPGEQAGFRHGFGIIDHLQTLRTIIEKSNLPIYLVFVDYQKALDYVETWAILNSLYNARIDSIYLSFIKHIYDTTQVKIDENLKTDKIPIKRGVR